MSGIPKIVTCFSPYYMYMLEYILSFMITIVMFSPKNISKIGQFPDAKAQGEMLRPTARWPLVIGDP